MTTWLFDLGNSRLKCAPLRADGEADVDAVREIAHDGSAFASFDVLPPVFELAFVASVAGPALTATLLDALAQRCSRISLARTQRRCDGVRIAYAQPRRLGVDRFLALLAAHARGAQPALVVGVGTALTIDLIDADGLHRGGRIAPSPTLMRDALHRRAPHLPASGGDYVEFAADTLAGLASGCDGAAIALITRSRALADDLLGTPPRVLLHGGGGAALLPHLDGVIAAPALVLEGLARWSRVIAP
jgi:type III pantothenate kinase